MNKQSAAFVCLVFLMMLITGGCSVTKHLESNEYLLIKNKIQISDHHIPPEDLDPYLQQKPNKKLFGLFRSNIAFYNLGNSGKETKFKTWLKTKVGSAPVILDTSLISVSLKQMNLYLGNKGYFQKTLSDSVIIKKKKATVIYRVQT
ncbi:MAG: hypothetical protein ACOYM0_15865, partial [Bacteroidales bacterium]